MIKQVAITSLSLFLLSTNISAANLNETKWTTKVEEDGFTDTKKVFAVIAAKGGIKQGFIHLGCFPSGFEGKVSTGQYIGDKDISNNFRYRVDKNEPVKTTMKATSERYVYFNNMSNPFIKALQSGQSKVAMLTF